MQSSRIGELKSGEVRGVSAGEMARRRVLALGPAMSRMMCMNNPYQQVRKSDSDEARPKRPWLWRRKKTLKLGGGEKRQRPRRRWGLRVGRLRIRLLSPLALLKRLCDSYVRMMFALENRIGAAGLQCAAGPAFPMYPMHMPGRMGTTFDPRIDFSTSVR